MGSYVVFYMLGLYPLPATKQVLLSSPYFPEVIIYNPLYGTNTTIRCTNWAEDGPVYVKVCVCSWLLSCSRVSMDRG